MGDRGNSKRVTLGDIKFIKFYDAISENDSSILGIDEDDFYALYDEFLDKSNERRNQLEIQLEKIDSDKNILLACYTILVKGLDPDIMPVLESQGIEVDNMERIDILDSIREKVESLSKKYKILATQRPPVPESAKTDAHQILASLSVALEMPFNFNKITVLEYLAYRKALDKKAEAIKQSQKKNKFKK